MIRAAVLVVLFIALAVPARAQPSQCFDETGFCIDQPAFQQYFAQRGGARILGFPVSRTFRLEGFQVQFFQRVVLQLQDGNVARLNLLDPGVLPVIHANQSTFPAPDADLAASAPRPESPAYAGDVLAYIQRVSPDSWNDQPVGFASLFSGTVPAEGVSPEIRTLLNLEIWGLPTSAPALDPGNGSFIYQRFQRGIMHYRADCRCTDGILVGDYLKAVLTGRDLPPDLANDMRGSRYFLQYSSSAPGWIARPGDLSDSDLTGAFEPGSAPVTQPTPVPALPTNTPAPAQPTATPIPQATAVPLADLLGQVKPSSGGVRVALLDLPVDALTANDGHYAIGNLPLGEHFVYAVDPQGKVSDTYRIDLSAGQVFDLNIDLQPFKPGQPALFIGRVTGSDVGNVIVWRLGGAGRTRANNQGQFQLVDTFANAENARVPDKVTLVAAKDGRWGMLRVDTTGNPNQPIQLELNKEGNPPMSPQQVFDFAGNSSIMRRFDGNQADFFTARWSDGGAGAVSLEILDKDNKSTPVDVKNNQCFGSCNGFGGSAVVVKLPRNDQPFTVKSNANPGWNEAQAVAYSR